MLAKLSNEPHPYTRGSRVDYTWSARFSFERPHSLEEVVLRKLGGLVTSFTDPEWPISGAVLVEGSAGNLTAALHVAADMGQERLVSEITDVETQVWQQ